MKRTRRLSLLGILLVGTAIGTFACGGAAEAPSPADTTTDGAVETVSLRIEGMT